jgi:hypothetical protein
MWEMLRTRCRARREWPRSAAMASNQVRFNWGKKPGEVCFLLMILLMGRVSNYVNEEELLLSIFECIFQFFPGGNVG